MQIERPNRVERSYVQRLEGPPERVFRLLCPVREADWLDGWDPVRVLSESGLAEEGCVFVTTDGADQTVWTVTRHEPAAGLVEMVRVTPGVTVCRLRITLEAAPHGTDATVAYRHTSLGPRGDDFVAAFTEAHYLAFMRHWERALNHYLRSGECLREAGDGG